MVRIYKKCFAFLSIIMVMSSCFNFVNAADNTLNVEKTIAVNGGEITGTLSSDGQVAIYKGIPYAAPPVGNLRWKEPQPVVPWSGVKNCSQFSPSAMQRPQEPFLMWSKEFIIDTSKGYSEDCLYLNVWSKVEDTNKKRPVIVYIHGGAFVSGGASCDVYDGEGLAKKDVVYVSMNYRVGIFGYLAHPELSAESKEGVSGNYGTLDQVAALIWVKNNIEKFGGDPNNVTIVGQSAGSASVNVLVMTPKARGLFKNAVTMSYNYIGAKMESMKNQEAAGAKLFQGKTLDDMRAIPANELVDLPYSSGPCIDGDVVPNDLLSMLKEGSENHVNMMTGMAAGDTFLFSIVPPINKNNGKTMSKEDFVEAVTNKFGAYSKECLRAYPVDGDNALSQFNAMNQDGNMVLQIYFAKARALKSNDPTYIYQFSHAMPGEKSDQYGAFHTADVPYFLNHFSQERKNYWTRNDYDLGNIMSSYLVNFAKWGNPNHEGAPIWKSYQGSMSYLNLKNSNRIQSANISNEKEKFWQDYYGSIFGI